MRDPQRAALDNLVRDYADIGTRSRMGLLISPGDSKTNYTVDVVGIIRQKRLLVLTAPTTDEGSLIAVIKGQLLTCRWFSATTRISFSRRHHAHLVRARAVGAYRTTTGDRTSHCAR